MASITIKKHTTQAACAGQINHIYRLNSNYANKEIVPALKSNNGYIQSPEQARENIINTIKEIDSRIPPKRLRADRKTVASLVVPAPRENISLEQTKQFFNKMLQELLADGYNLVAAAYHVDEIHTYIDPGDKQQHQSRPHMHILVIPETDKGCNMKSWLTKQRYREINSIADRACEKTLGYLFQDGTRAKSRGTVEIMKEQSAAVAEAQKVMREAQERVQEAQERLLKAFPEEISIDSILESKTVKMGILRPQEEVLVVKNPETVQSAMNDAAALVIRLRETENELEKTKKQLQQTKAQLQEAKQLADYYKPYERECRYRKIAKDLAAGERELEKYVLSEDWKTIEPYYQQECNILAYKQLQQKTQRLQKER